MSEKFKIAVAGLAAGAISGLFGTGGGMILVPMLTALTTVDETDVFSTSVSIILPICIVSILVGIGAYGFPLQQAFPYLLGGITGGIFAGIVGKRIPVKWLHRALGLLILWGGIRYLC